LGYDTSVYQAANMPDFPAGYLAQLASPFTWRRLRRV
jgi:hypothetical protein